MRVITDTGAFDLGVTEATPTIGITDYSRRVTDDFGVTTVVERGFSRRMSVRLGVPASGVDALQQRLAGLRATSATWIADNASEWLSVEGYYKDFSLDVALSPLSYCTLTIEGIAQTETVADPGGDPAPDGMLSNLQLLQPMAVSDATLSYSTVGETDYAAWSSATTYPVGARVIRAATHRIYESAASGNLNHDPAAATGEWIDVGPTNRWAMFDQALGTTTKASGLLEVSIDAAAANAVALVDLVADYVRVRAGTYDQTLPVGPGTLTFFDLPTTTGPVIVTVTGTADLSVDTLLVGRVMALGVTEASPSAGITDYSRKVTDDFGEVTVAERAWAKRMTTNALIRTDAIDLVANRIATARSLPSLWIGNAGTDALTIYGFFKDFLIQRDEKVSKLSLSIEGLSKAAPLPEQPIVYVPRGDYDPAASYAVGNVIQYQGSSWLYIGIGEVVGHAPPALPETENEYWKVFARAGADGDGQAGQPGVDGKSSYLHLAYANSANGQVDFTIGAPGGRTYLGVLVDQTPADSTNPSAYKWSLIKGADGTNGTPGAPGANGLPTYVHIAYANNATGTLNFSVDDPSGRAFIGFYTDQTLADSTNPALYAWSLVKGADGRDGLNGTNGTNGTPGAPGADGRSSYLHIAYANSIDGTVDFSTTAPAGRKYLGTLVDQAIPDSTNPALYTWSLIKGADGLNGMNGTPGAPGADGQPTYVHIAYSNAIDGSIDFSVDDPADRAYVGFYVDQAAADSGDRTRYTWSLVKGADGSGANRVVLSNFAQGLRGFRPGSGSLTGFVPYGPNGSPAGQLDRGINLPGWFGQRQVAYAHYNQMLKAGGFGDYIDAFWTPSPWQGGDYAESLGYMMPVMPGDTLYARVLAAPHRCIFALYILLFDGAGNYLAAPEFIGGIDGGGGGGVPTNFGLVGGIVPGTDIPATARWASLLIRMKGNGGNDPYIFFTEPAMGKLGIGQTSLPPYSDGPSDPLADITALNQHSVAPVPDIVIQADYQGSPAAGQFPVTRSIRRMLGSNDVSPNTSYTVTLTGNLANTSGQPTINNTAGSDSRGDLTLTAGSAGTAIVTSTYLGNPIVTEIHLSTNLAAAPAGGGGGGGSGGGATPGGAASTSTFAAPGTSSSYVLLATLPAVTVGGSGKIDLSAAITYHQLNSSGAFPAEDEPPGTNLNVAVNRSINGGAQAGVVTAIGDGAVRFVRLTPPKGLRDYPGYLGLEFGDTGLPGGTSVVYYLYGFADPPDLGATSLSGTFSATPR